MRSNVVIVGCILILASAIRPAFAQTGLPGPRFDVGIDATATAASGVSGAGLTGRVTVNFDPDLALAARADLTTVDDRRDYVRARARRAGLELHRNLFRRGAFAIEGLLGAGVRRQTDLHPVFDRTGVLTEWRERRRSLATGTIGIGATHRLGSFVEWREDFRLDMASTGLDASVSTGLTVPIGRYLTRRAGQSARIGRGEVRTGQRVWVTTGGAVVDGRVGDVTSGTIEVLTASGRQAIDVSAIDRLETVDAIRDGVRLGAILGGIGFGVYGALIASPLCECDNLGTTTILAMSFAGMGTAGGALVGGLSDGLHVGRRLLVGDAGRAAVTVRPMVTERGAGALALLRW